MCGIYGEVSPDLVGHVRDSDERALDRLAHRGPDDSGTWAAPGVFLGMRRLSIIDLTGGAQPIWNEDGTLVIVYNGELYNFLELRRELEGRGHRFRTRSDTEVVLHAFEQWGPRCLQRFNGMFAFAIWDVRSKRLFLARDRIGEKPLYYHWDGHRLVFASEIKAILAHPSVPRRVDHQGLANYLAFGHSVAPKTIYEEIHKVLPGHYLEATAAGIRESSYWDVGADDAQVVTGATAVDLEKSVLELLDDSVARRLVADVDVGAFLSGGVDSSAVVALMARHATGRVKTFSLGFSVGGDYDELADARGIARFLGTDHHELRLDHLDLVETLRTLVYHYDEPFADAASFPVFLLSRFAREHVKVVLTGDGGDELFGGYRRYAADQAARLYQRLPSLWTERWLPATVDRIPRLRRIKSALHTLPIEDPGRRYATWLEVFSPELRQQLLKTEILETLDGYDPAGGYPGLYAALNGNCASDHLNRLMYVDLKTWLVDAYMEKTDKATMACGLEARLPLLDHRLVELAFQIPGNLKIRGWSTKRIFKRAVRGIVPTEVLRRPKHGFSVPTDPWFRGELKDFAFEVLFDPATLRRGYFNARVVDRLWRDHIDGRQVWDSQLWVLMNFELWSRTFLDNDVSSPAPQAA